MELIPHLWDAVRAGPVDVVIEFHPPMTVDTAGGRKALAAAAEAIVREGQARALSGAHWEPPRASALERLRRRRALAALAKASA
jgi:hypothetical protein